MEERDNETTSQDGNMFNLNPVIIFMYLLLCVKYFNIGPVFQGTKLLK